MGNQAPVLGSEKGEQLQGLVVPSSGGIHMVYTHVTVSMDRWNKLRFGGRHPFLLSWRPSIADLKCLAFRWLKLGVRGLILNVSLQQWILNEVLELYLTTLPLINLFLCVSCGYCGCNCVLF